MGLNPCSNGRYSQRKFLKTLLKVAQVLILVLMEDTLRALIYLCIHYRPISLNPCSNGRYSQSYVMQNIPIHYKSLNPCSNGRYSQSKKKFGSKIQKPVLILVLMEDTLRGYTSIAQALWYRGLNPCSNGRYSQRI